MATQTLPSPLRARTAVILTPEQRALRCEAARWALTSGRPLNLDAVTVIIAARSFESAMEGRPFNRWTAQSTLGFLWGTAAEWCGSQGVEVPHTLAETLWTWFDFLAAHRQFANGSSTRTALRAVLVETGGLNRSGRSNRRQADALVVTVPAGRRPSPTDGAV